MRALIGGGGIGGLAAAVALQRVGITAAVFEKAPQITEVGAGLSLWSTAIVALRRLGLEAAALKAESVIERTRTFHRRIIRQHRFRRIGREGRGPFHLPAPSHPSAPSPRCSALRRPEIGTEENAILRNDVVDLPARRVWGA